MSKFQIIVLAVFGIFIVIGVAVFATTKSSESKSRGQTVIWGTVNESVFSKFISDVKSQVDDKLSVVYVYKTPENFDQEFVEALASGKGPDAILLSQDILYKNRERIIKIPFSSMPEKTFKDTFIEEGELFLNPNGVSAIPLVVDPLVMYWNRDLFTSAGIPLAPKTWEEVSGLTSKLTVKSSNGVIIKSAVPMGEWKNIKNAKGILSALLLQAGDYIVSTNGTDSYSSTLGMRVGTVTAPANSVLRFFTDFSNPQKSVYSWNRSLPNSQDTFIAGDGALYFGFGSELFTIKNKNPNLNFDITYLPQVKSAERRVTFGRILGIAIVRSSVAPESALANILSLSNQSSVKLLSDALNIAPARRDLLVQTPDSAYKEVLYGSAIISKAWIDPDTKSTDNIFMDMVESITTGRSDISSSVNRAKSSMNVLFNK